MEETLMRELTPLRVLLVDSADYTRQDLSKLILQNLKPVIIQTTDDGESAVNIFREFMPHIVITEIILPKIDGWQICKTFRTIEKAFNRKPALLISLSSIGFEINQTEAPKAGIDYFYEKPLDKTLKRVLLDLLLKKFQDYA